MAPEIRHGDVVICSPSVPAADGAAAVVQLKGQIGVTCKLFRRAGQTVHLVPINEQYAPQAFSARRMVWAQKVLARVRPGPPAPRAS
jgi:SOS-response transcriptional repressor LexA